jgi:hypothetical protein
MLTNITKSLENLTPNTYGGAMFANENEFHLYGGLIQDDNADDLPDADQSARYSITQYGAPKPLWVAGWKAEDLSNYHLTRYLANGAGVNVPSEQMSYYFGGLRVSIESFGSTNVHDVLTSV